MNGELLFVLAVCVVIAVLVGLCVYEGLMPRNPRLVAPDDLETLRRHADARSACRRAGLASPPEGSRYLSGGVQRQAGGQLQSEPERNITDAWGAVRPTTVGSDCALYDWAEAGWA